ILGIDLEPAHATAARRLVEALGIPAFVTPKAKGMFPEDHPLFYGVAAGVSGDAVILDLFKRADLLVRIGFEPGASDKLWHQPMPLVSIGPMTIAADDYRPPAEAYGDVGVLLADLSRRSWPRYEWEPGERDRFRAQLVDVLRPSATPAGLSPYELTRRLRDLFPPATIFPTGVRSGQH